MKCVLASLIAVVLCATVLAADTPQFRGPNRDGIYAETGLLKAWPEGGPKLAWQADGLGKGYSSVAVVNGTVYTAGMGEDKQGYVFALGLDGKLKWKAPYGPETEEKMAPGARSTPTIDGDRLYLQSGLGAVVCLSIADGKKLWSVDAATEFKAKEVLWVFSESLLVDGNLVYVTPGGPDASVVALDKMTGKTAWTSKGLSDASAYCSPAIFTLGGKRELVQWLAENLVGIDPKSGEVLWQHHQKVPWNIHANTPIGIGNTLFYSAESGGGAIEIADGKTVKQVYTFADPQVLHHGTVLRDGFVYCGAFQKPPKLYCVDFATGKEKWSTETIGEASVVYADGMLYCYESPKKGLVHLVKCSPEKLEETGVLQIPKAADKHWAHPAIADGKLFIRFNGTLYAYDIAAK